MMKPLAVLAVTTLLGACAPMATVPSVPADAAQTAESEAALDALADRYVKLQLAIGTHEPGYIDAYYGPPEWQAAAETNPVSKARLLILVAELRSAIEDVKSGDALEGRRIAWLTAQLNAAETRLRMMMGEAFSFAQEAGGLFGVRPVIAPLESFDPILEEIDALVPGSEGDLAARVAAFESGFVIPKDRLRPVFDAAFAECAKRTRSHIALPPGESFDLEFVTGKAWSGYNFYKGDYRSLIQVNTDLPIRIHRAIDLGCHEGYPGHHVLNSLLEERLVKARHWREFSVYPLFSPQSLIAEGSANYGIELAFPGYDLVDFEREALYPLAGLDPAKAGPYWALQIAKRSLALAEITIAQTYLDGEIDRPAAVAALEKYELMDRATAEKRVDFIEKYRSYVLNYSQGQNMVRSAVEADGAEDERWRRFEAIISEPTLPGELTADQ